MPSATPAPLPATGLLLTGGGARAAYQVGVLEAIAMRQSAPVAPAIHLGAERVLVIGAGRRINQTLALIPPELRAGSHLRPLELLVISPSQRIDAIAARHVDALPGPVRRLFGGLGAGEHGDVKGAALASYLLFESAFTRELMALGRADTLRQRDEVLRFFGWQATASFSAA